MNSTIKTAETVEEELSQRNESCNTKNHNKTYKIWIRKGLKKT